MSILPYIETEELQPIVAMVKPIVAMVKPRVAKVNEELQWLVKELQWLITKGCNNKYGYHQELQQ